jgi:hypothetical protein
MTQSLWVAIPLGILLLAFIVFAFRQGMKVTPGDGDGSNNQNHYPPGNT